MAGSSLTPLILKKSNKSHVASAAASKVTVKAAVTKVPRALRPSFHRSQGYSRQKVPAATQELAEEVKYAMVEGAEERREKTKFNVSIGASCTVGIFACSSMY